MPMNTKTWNTCIDGKRIRGEIETTIRNNTLTVRFIYNPTDPLHNKLLNATVEGSGRYTITSTKGDISWPGALLVGRSMKLPVEDQAAVLELEFTK